MWKSEDFLRSHHPDFELRKGQPRCKVKLQLGRRINQHPLEDLQNEAALAAGTCQLTVGRGNNCKYQKIVMPP
jgi:hypothetical protein